MKIKLLWLYSDLMNLYGSSGNMRCIEKHINENGVETEIVKASLNDEIDFSDVDFVYMGAGTEKSQKRALEDIKRHKIALSEYIEKGGVCLFCGNSFELLGEKIIGQNNELEALGFFPFETYQKQKRVVVDTVCTCPLTSEKIIGFMNKQSSTTIVTNPLFRVLSGAGNAPDRNDEGIQDKNLFATQLSGPILVRNPHLRAVIEERIYKNKGIELMPLYFVYEQKAFEQSLKGLNG